MKRLSAILLLAVLFFNLYGYRLLISYWQAQEENSLETQINTHNIKDEELVSIKVPVTLPYYTNSASFEQIDGEVSIEGILYKYVKRRIYNDSIEFLCVQNTKKMRLENARDEFFKLCNDLQAATHQNKKPSGPSPVKPLLLEYCQTWLDITLATPIELASNLSDSPSSFYLFTLPVTLDHPPELI